MSDEDKSGDDKMQAILDGIVGITKACDSIRSEVDTLKGRMDTLEGGMPAGTAADRAKKDAEDKERMDSYDDEFDDPKVLAKLTPEERRKREGLALTAKIDAQAKMDAVARSFCESAPPPMTGERVMAYRRRIAEPWKVYSDEFKNVDLERLPASAFKAIESRIIADAIHADQTRVVPAGQLREHRTSADGHTIVTWSGHPSGWMNRYAGGGQRATGSFNIPRFGGR